MFHCATRSIEFAKKYRVPLRVRPSYSDEAGTLIAALSDEAAPVVTGVALVRNEARVSLCDIPDRPGVMSLIFSKMAERKIPIDMVVQDVATGGRLLTDSRTGQRLTRGQHSERHSVLKQREVASTL